MPLAGYGQKERKAQSLRAPADEPPLTSDARSCLRLPPDRITTFTRRRDEISKLSTWRLRVPGWYSRQSSPWMDTAFGTRRAKDASYRTLDASQCNRKRRSCRRAAGNVRARRGTSAVIFAVPYAYWLPDAAWLHPVFAHWRVLASNSTRVPAASRVCTQVAPELSAESCAPLSQHDAMHMPRFTGRACAAACSVLRSAPGASSPQIVGVRPFAAAVRTLRRPRLAGEARPA
jgi:hypothetical protein